MIKAMRNSIKDYIYFDENIKTYVKRYTLSKKEYNINPRQVLLEIIMPIVHATSYDKIGVDEVDNVTIHKLSANSILVIGKIYNKSGGIDNTLFFRIGIDESDNDNISILWNCSCWSDIHDSSEDY